MEVKVIIDRFRIGTQQRTGLHKAGGSPGPGAYNQDDRVTS